MSKWPIGRNIIIGGILVIAAVAGVIWFSSQSAQPNEAVAFTGEPKYTELTPQIVRTARFIDMGIGGALAAQRNAEVDEQEADWAASEFLPATAPLSTLVAAWQSSVRDPERVLTRAQRESLLRKIAEYTNVRAQTTPDAYFELAAREPNLIWHDPTGPYNHLDSTPFREKLSWLYENYGDGPVDPNADTPQLLRDIWRPMMDTYGQRIAEVGVGERGAAIIIMRTRLPVSVLNGGFVEPYASQHGLQLERWVGYATSWARPFRVPVRTSDDVLDQHGIVTIAAAHIVVRLALGKEHLSIWPIVFYFDPDAEAWRAELMGRTGARNWQIVF